MSQARVLAAALILAPLGTQAADLVVWWEKGAVRGKVWRVLEG